MSKQNKKLPNKVLQEFVDNAYVDEELQTLMDEFRIAETKTGTQDPTILLKIFDHLDKKFKLKVKTALGG